MAITQHLHKPALFITFTANPYWSEIQRELQPGQQAENCPDLTSRVFHMKTRELLDDLKRKYIFSTYKGSVYTIEYQKQGLPHIYLLLFLPLEEQFRNAEQVDEIISAEFSMATDDLDGILMDVVASVMVHGPCSQLNPKAKCMTLNPVTNCKKCCKGFPKPFQPETIICDDGYPLYCCQNNGIGYDIPHPLYDGQSYRVTSE